MNVFDIICLVIGIGGALWSAYGILKGLKEKEFGLDILALVAIIATMLVGEYLASVVVVIMTLTGDFLERYAGKQAEKEIANLISNVPEKAMLEDGTTISANEVKIGDVLIITPGSVVPVDGTAKEIATLNEASLTGESLPVSKNVGDLVLSGSVSEGKFLLTATALAQNSSYQKITELAKLAKTQKAPAVRIANTISIPFTFVSLIIAIVAWIIAGDPMRFAEVLVLATPCPLLIAAPVAFLAGLSKAAKKGIIIKGGGALEALSRVQIAAFDKTGTVTNGQPQFDRLELTEDGKRAGFSEEKALQYAASLEQFSNHILAQAIVLENKLPLLNVDNQKEVFGRGVQGDIENQRIWVQKPPHEHPINPGETAVELLVGGIDVAHIYLVDHIRPEAASSIERMRKLGVKHLVMLTGDKRETAQYIAKQAGIEDVRSSLLPHQKYEIVLGIRGTCVLNPNCADNAKRSAKESVTGHTVMMVGDGVNDAPTLMAADVGIALGAKGSTAASESADVVIMRDDFSLVADSLAISHRTMTIAKESMIGGITLSVLLMLVASFGFIPAVFGAVLQEIIDLFAIVNGVRARK